MAGYWITYGLDSTASTTTWAAWNAPQNTGDDAWIAWQGTATTTTNTDYEITWLYWSAPVELSEKKRKEARRRAQREAEIERQRINAAKERSTEERKRAAALLEAYLSDEQRAALKEKNAFEVESQTGKRYLIRRGRAGNVFSLDEHRRKVKQHCIHPSELCPDEDTMLTQMMWLRWNEVEFLKVANTSQLFPEAEAVTPAEAEAA